MRQRDPLGLIQHPVASGDVFAIMLVEARRRADGIEYPPVSGAANGALGESLGTVAGCFHLKSFHWYFKHRVLITK
jgi:hypothetical protein